MACNDVKRGQGVGLIWAGGCMSREGGLYKYEQVHTWSCSSGLEEMRWIPCALDGCGYMSHIMPIIRSTRDDKPHTVFCTVTQTRASS